MKFKDGYMVSSGQPTKDYIDYAVRHVLLRQESLLQIEFLCCYLSELSLLDYSCVKFYPLFWLLLPSFLLDSSSVQNNILGKKERVEMAKRVAVEQRVFMKETQVKKKYVQFDGDSVSTASRCYWRSLNPEMVEVEAFQNC
ncbi:hypothetical protein Bca52824_094764 [Brassica carinata]|uniref:Uncharacterized protein n=1 Tax=Brassica carinata TaxID=52824 RepID=A0A8X7TIW1_BRACI|nr:hypothetical protein Bca52824_094764 [Brassica carinata]